MTQFSLPVSTENSSSRRRQLDCAAMKGDWLCAYNILISQREAVREGITEEADTMLHTAAKAGQTVFVERLVQRMTKEDLKQKNKSGNTALFNAVSSGFTSIAKIMVQRNPELPGVRNANDYLPLHVAALHGHWEVVQYLYDVTTGLKPDDYVSLLTATINADLFGTKVAYAKKLQHMQALRLVEKIFKQLSSMEGQTPTNPLLDAAKFGIAEIVTEFTSSFPNAEWDILRDIFHSSIKNRQIEIFKLIHSIEKRDYITSYVDENEQNILHLAGKLPPELKNDVLGADLQMQRQLLLFKEVEKALSPLVKEKKDKSGKTPRELFNEEHKPLAKMGEKCVKSRASSYMTVAALITSMMFAAFLAVQGWKDKIEGTPSFLEPKAFKTFAISDAFAFVSSFTSVLVFLFILTSHHTQKDFLEFLPNMLIVGLTTLTLSIISMLVAVIAIFIMVYG